MGLEGVVPEAASFRYGPTNARIVVLTAQRVGSGCRFQMHQMLVRIFDAHRAGRNPCGEKPTPPWTGGRYYNCRQPNTALNEQEVQ
jgi:hypothetical protein